MKKNLITVAGSLLLVMLWVSAAIASKSNMKLIDSGSFGVFIRGTRVATETFKIEQGATMSSLHSEIRLESNNVAQSSDMEFMMNGDLARYTWQALGPQKAELTVEPKDEFLVERFTADPAKDKMQEIPHLLAASTAILDDNFFSQREVLMWRYLASGCPQASGPVKCNLLPTQYGVFIPNQHASSTVSLEYKGMQKIAIKGVEKQLGTFHLQTDSGDWFLYLDENQKLVRIVIPSQNTEIVRD